MSYQPAEHSRVQTQHNVKLYYNLKTLNVFNTVKSSVKLRVVASNFGLKYTDHRLRKKKITLIFNNDLL